MASLAERRRNNVRAGVFMGIAMLLTVGSIVAVSGAWESLFRDVRHYTVRYPVAEGVRNLERGSVVRVGGVTMGKVNDVRPDLKPGEPFDQINVDFELDQAVRLYVDARVYVSAPLLGSEAWLDITSVGDPEAGDPPGGVLPGAPTVGMLTSVLGADSAAKTDEIVENVRRLSDFLGEVPQEYEEHVAPVLDDVKETTGDIRALAERVREKDWPRWAGSVDEVMTWATAFTERLDGAVADGHALLRDARAAVNENRPSIDEIVGNVRAATEDARAVTGRVRDETVDKANRLLDSGQEALALATDTIRQVQLDYDGWSTDVGEALASATLASQQLKLTTIEVRRSPWKLLYRPSETELEHELLYDAARSFALATADLKAAARSVQTIMDRHGELPERDPELFERLRRNLLDPLRNYERAQSRLLDVLLTE